MSISRKEQVAISKLKKAIKDLKDIRKPLVTNREASNRLKKDLDVLSGSYEKEIVKIVLGG